MENRTLTVKGVGKASLKPDLIIITMNLVTTNPEYEKTMDLALDEIDKIRKALIEIGYQKEDLKTTDFDFESDYDRVFDDNDDDYKQIFIGYKCIHRLKLELDLDMSLLGKTLYAITSCCVNPDFDIEFSIKDKINVETDLLENAVTNAKSNALILANASGVKLGNIITINYSWGELKLFSNTMLNFGAGQTSSRNFAKSISIEPDNIQLNDSVTVVWSIE